MYSSCNKGDPDCQAQKQQKAQSKCHKKAYVLSPYNQAEI